jgi:hypothetical protein
LSSSSSDDGLKGSAYSEGMKRRTIKRVVTSHVEVEVFDRATQTDPVGTLPQVDDTGGKHFK